MMLWIDFFVSSRRRHTRCALVTGVQTCALPILMVFPSLGYKSDPRETAQWYREIAAAAALPIMIYNNPIAYGVDVTPAVLEALADVPEIVCVTEETGDIRRVTDLYVALGDRVGVFCGDESGAASCRASVCRY